MVRLRPAIRSDWAALFSWRNDPLTREMSNDTGVIDLVDHMAWLDRAINNGLLWIATDQEGIGPGALAGTCRADPRPPAKQGPHKGLKAYELSLTVEPRLRGRGYAAAMIAAMVVTLRQPEPKVLFLAQVKAQNMASLRAFAECGFMPADIGDNGVVTLTMVV